MSNFTLVECLDKYGIEGLKELLSHAKMRGADTRELLYSFSNTDLELFIMAFEYVEPSKTRKQLKIIFTCMVMVMCTTTKNLS